MKPELPAQRPESFESFVTYSRQSTSGQEENTSEVNQKAVSYEFGRRNGWELHSEVYDNHTGKQYLERKNVHTVLDLVESGVVTYVVFYDVDRIARDSSLIKKFLKDIYLLGGKVGIARKGRWYRTYNEVKKDVFFESMLAEAEADTIKERLDIGKFQRFLQGSRTGLPVYGFRNMAETRNGKKFVTLDPHPIEAAAVKEFYLEYLRTKSTIISVRKVNEIPDRGRARKGIPTQFNLKLAANLLEHVDRYAGKPFEMTSTNPETGERESSTFTYPSLISREDAVKIKEIYVIRTRSYVKDKPFNKLVYCEECNKPAYIRIRNGKLTHSCSTHHNLLHKASQTGSKVDCICTGRMRSHIIAGRVVAILTAYSGDNLPELLEGEYSELGYNYKKTLELMESYIVKITELKKQKDTLVNNNNDMLEMYPGREDRELIVKPYHLENRAKIKSIDENLTKNYKMVKEYILVTQKMKQILDYLGFSFSNEAENEALRYGFGEKINTAITHLVQAIRNENWEVVSSIMVRLGLRIFVDFAEKDLKDRLYGVSIRADFDFLEAKSGEDTLVTPLLATATCPGAYSCAVTTPTGMLALTSAPTTKVSG